MTLAVPHSASITNITLRCPADVSAIPGYDIAGTLMDTALEQIEDARSSGNEAWLESVVLIIVELRATLDLRRGGAIAANVDDLYDYMCRRLRSAGLPNGLAALHEVSHLLHALRSAWAFLPTEMRAAPGN